MAGVSVFTVLNEPTADGAVLRPGPGRVFVITLGAGSWVPLAFLLVGLVLTNGSGWSLLFAFAGLGVAWLRARQVAAWRDGGAVVVRNFHSTSIVAVEPATVLRPFTHWAQPNFDCYALYTPGHQVCRVHATAPAQRHWRRVEEAGRTEQTLGVPLSPQAIGTWQQLRRPG